MQSLESYKPVPIVGKLTTYAAKYNIEFFRRKRIPSYALWSVYIKQGRRYPKTPQGYGAAATLDRATIDMRRFIDDHNINWDYVRNDGLERWKAIKCLIVQRDYSQVPKLLDKATNYNGI
ncbi:hypothetical protein [Methyloglobulus sp.]|uniref:hypothetical protein n=1 Tax=Methyloglobulus sp. TaxID=2518622 RepID=UPI0032B712DB